MGVVRARAADANKQETHLSHRARPDAVQPARYDENVADEGQIEGVLRAQKTGTVEKKTAGLRNRHLRGVSAIDHIPGQ